MRLSQKEFLALIDTAKSAGGDAYRPDDEQATAVYADPASDLFIVAGPGTGKTSCLSYRTLYLIFCADYVPSSIVVTTFTKKAAAELRSRLLGWGYSMVDSAAAAGLDAEKLTALRAIDLNQIVTGTLDSLAERILREHRGPNEEPPILADEYVARTELLRSGLLNEGRYKSKSLEQVLLSLNGGSTWGFNIARKADLLNAIANRRHNDLVDMQQFLQSAPKSERKGRQRILEALADYDAAMTRDGILDFAQLERRLADGLTSGAYQGFTKNIRALLVDEYQDTNLLQETIYLSVAKMSGASITVVGDDDQSLYRFRGATVELFRDCPLRIKRKLRRNAVPVFLTRNYRSTKSIVRFVGDYAELDPGFGPVRVRGKPRIAAYRPTTSDLPVMGMFRNTRAELAQHLAQFIHQVFRGKGFKVNGEVIQCGTDGNVGDAAILCHSPREDGDKRLVSSLRAALSTLAPPIKVFNPRGEEFAKLPLLQVFGGLILEALDPDDSATATLRSVGRDTKTILGEWRQAAQTELRKKNRADLRQYVMGWQRRQQRSRQWPQNVPAIDLVYALRHWFPEFQGDPEQQVYFEAFTRQLSVAEDLGSFGGSVITDPTNASISQKSIEHLIRDFLGPIASGVVGVNEELVTAFPRDRISVLSIHQSKGLEFPVVIVDVGAQFSTNNVMQRRLRFPEDGDLPHRLEDAMRPFSDLGVPKREMVDRAFDDLIRLYYVAFSRARDLLILVGITPNNPVRNVAQGWTRKQVHRWSPNSPYFSI